MAKLPIDFQILQIFRTLFNINTLSEKRFLSWIFLFLMDYLTTEKAFLSYNHTDQTRSFKAYKCHIF